MSSNATAGPETLVGSHGGLQENSSTAALVDGGWVVTWESYGDDGMYDGILQQRFGADGAASGVRTLVNTYTTGAQVQSSATGLADGGWVVTWASHGQDGSNSGIYQQRYAANGTPSGGETRVNTYTTSFQDNSSTTALADGGWVATWQSYGPDGSVTGIYQQRYAANSAPSGGETRVNTYTSGYQEYSSVTPLADGGWVVTWVSYGSTAAAGQDGSEMGIYQQRYAANGATSGSEIRVNAYTPNSQSDPSITALADGGWVVAWESESQDGSGYGVYQQRYAANGAVSGSEIRVNTYTTDDQDTPFVTALADGGWVVTWESDGQDGSGYGIYQQRYGSNGVASGTETHVNTSTNLDQAISSVTALADGSWVVTWTSKVSAANEYAIYQRHFAADVVGTSLDNSLNGTTWDENIYGQGGNDTLTGGAGSDVLDGGTGGDVLNGGTGGDTMYGRAGNDIYVVDSSGDTVDEAGGDGTDLVQSSISFTLGVGFENLILTGTDSIDGTGNSLANVLTGNSGANTLDGGDGNDMMAGGAGSDIYIVDSSGDTVDEAGGDGTDLVQSSISYTLGVNFENLILTGTDSIDGTGSALANVLTGNSGANTLDGGGGNDTMSGGTGDDTYIVGSSGDTVDESGGDGTDLVQSSVSFTLGIDIENLTLIGGNIAGNGNTLANILIGNSRANKLNGMAGIDALTGGNGKDTFVFSTALNDTNVDDITDFNHLQDDFDIENAVFRGLKVGDLAKADFTRIANAESNAGVDRSDRILYDQKRGDLYFDRDGAGNRHDRVLFTHVTDGSKLNHTDFDII
jgi:Ca2+-binding RTX toxin-like protein